MFNVVHLIYQEKPWDSHHKDYEFSALSMRDHWASGLADIRRTLAHPDWLAPPEPTQTTGHARRASRELGSWQALTQ